MNQDKNHVNDSREVINLIDVIMQLRQGKWIIVTFVFLTTIISGIYLMVAKEQWISEAIVTYPDAGQIANYNNSLGILYSLNPTNAPAIVDVQKQFFGRFNSAISALSEQLDNQDVPEKLTMTPTVPDQIAPIKIRYTASSAADAQKTLITYIQQINKRVVTELDDDLNSSINSKLETLKNTLATKEKVAQEKKDERLQVLNQALIIAKQSNIKNTLVQQAETLSEDTLFVLGSEALSATIKNEATRPLPLDASYFNTRQMFLAVNVLKTSPSTTYSFSYVMKPNLPIRRDSPKIPLTLVLGVLVGVILGSGVVICRNAMRDYHR